MDFPPVDSVPGAMDSAAVREAGRELLSLALIDARNHTLNLLTHLEQSLGPRLVAPAGAAAVTPPLWSAGHIAWLAEYWIGRNPQRALGPACPREGTRLASVDPEADGWFDPRLAPPDERAGLSLPEVGAVKAYLLDTLESTLELLDKSAEGDTPLYFFRMALYHEDLRGEDLAVAAQSLGVPLALDLPRGAPPREPLALPAARWTLGGPGRGFTPAAERGEDTIDVPEFDIDTQPVSWAQFVEFIADGGYDREELWRAEGWQWLARQAQAEGRRGPRHVEQIGVASGAVMQTLFGRATRMGGSQPAMHVAWWEADAYARWAGRRLPTEVEWEVAAHAASRRGFRWGDVLEWTAGTLRPFEGFVADAWATTAEIDPQAAFGRARVLRGASFAARARMKHVKARAWALPEEDRGFFGFRTCSI